MQELIKILDPNLVFDSKEIDTGRSQLTIWAHMETKEAQCPYCGTWSSSVQGHYTRVLKDFTVMGMPTEIRVATRKFYCPCDSCSHKTFAEVLPFAERYSRKTNRLWKFVDELHSCMSAAEAAELLSDTIFSVHFSTLTRHLHKLAAAVEPVRAYVAAICIDDLALRKRCSYATAIIDAVTHELLDIISSRTAEEVTKALEQYPGLQLVSRDGAACFRNGVPGLQDGDCVIQITDRFHVLMNCTRAAELYLKARLPKALPLSGPTERQPAEQPGKALIQRRIRVLATQQLRESGMSVREIAGELGICEGTVRRYLKTDPDALQSGNRQKFEKLVPHLKKIGELLAQGVCVKTIFEAIKERGYKGGVGLLYEYVRARKAGNISIPAGDTLSRALLLKRLYKSLEKIPLLDQKDFERAIELYPFVAEVFDWVDQLRAIMEIQDAAGLDGWLDDSEKFKSKAIESYVNGLRRDRAALNECIELPFSNGPMEGTVGKLKVIRRIMFGRCSFEFFRLKALAKERFRRARQERLRQTRLERNAA